MKDVYERVSKWNSLRYERVNNCELSCNLLAEEQEEYFDANGNRVEELDAMCDVIFVALGVTWKLNLSQKEMDENLNKVIPTTITLVSSDTLLPPICMLTAYIKAARVGYLSQKSLAAIAYLLAMSQLSYDGYTDDQIYRALIVVCDSNDSKSVQKTESDVKANKSKGNYYIPPTVGLTKIVTEVFGDEHHRIFP